MFYSECPQWDRHKRKHTVLLKHTHFHVWPTGPFQWNGPYLFLVVLATTWCGVVASQSVAARRFPRVCVFLFLPSSSFLFSFFVSPAFFLLFCIPPPIFLSLSLFLFLLQAQVLTEVQYRMPADCCFSHSLPSEMVCCSIPLSMSAAEHGRPRLLHYITVSAWCCRALIMRSLSTFSQLTVEELVHLHTHGCTAGIGYVLFRFIWFLWRYCDPVCVH